MSYMLRKNNDNTKAHATIQHCDAHSEGDKDENFACHDGRKINDFDHESEMNVEEDDTRDDYCGTDITYHFKNDYRSDMNEDGLLISDEETVDRQFPVKEGDGIKLDSHEVDFAQDHECSEMVSFQEEAGEREGLHSAPTVNIKPSATYMDLVEGGAVEEGCDDDVTENHHPQIGAKEVDEERKDNHLSDHGSGHFWKKINHLRRVIRMGRIWTDRLSSLRINYYKKDRENRANQMSNVSNDIGDEVTNCDHRVKVWNNNLSKHPQRRQCEMRKREYQFCKKTKTSSWKHIEEILDGDLSFAWMKFASYFLLLLGVSCFVGSAQAAGETFPPLESVKSGGACIITNVPTEDCAILFFSENTEFNCSSRDHFHQLNANYLMETFYHTAAINSHTITGIFGGRM